MAFTVRLEDEKLLNAFDHIARLHGLSRNSFIEHLIRQTVADGFIPIRRGEGLKATSPNGGVLSLIMADGYVTSGSHNLTPAEGDIFTQAQQLAQNGGWVSAYHLLSNTAFTVEAITTT